MLGFQVGDWPNAAARFRSDIPPSVQVACQRKPSIRRGRRPDCITRAQFYTSVSGGLAVRPLFKIGNRQVGASAKDHQQRDEITAQER